MHPAGTAAGRAGGAPRHRAPCTLHPHPAEPLGSPPASGCRLVRSFAQPRRLFAVNPASVMGLSVGRALGSPVFGGFGREGMSPCGCRAVPERVLPPSAARSLLTCPGSGAGRSIRELCRARSRAGVSPAFIRIPPLPPCLALAQQHAGTCSRAARRLRAGPHRQRPEEVSGVGMRDMGSGWAPIRGAVPISPWPGVPGEAGVVRRGLVDAGSSAVLYGLRGLH